MADGAVAAAGSPGGARAGEVIAATGASRSSTLGAATPVRAVGAVPLRLPSQVRATATASAPGPEAWPHRHHDFTLAMMLPPKRNLNYIW